MLLDEDPAKLLKECRLNFNLHPDRLALTRISDSLTTLSEARAMRLAAAESGLKKLSRHLSSLSAQHAVSVSGHNPTEHASAILALDSRKFRVAKEASDLEIEGERLAGEVRGAQGQLRELEAQGVEGPEVENRDDEGDVLRLKLYRSLGIDVEMDEAGRCQRAVVRNAAKGSAHVVDIDEKFSRQFYANHFWQTLGS